ncbi:MAG: HAMP domain-containing histidine kinase, partial [Spirochaetales bacterium]|nr:HAMP domain-containing histidine kinase [Spirochaetales bacterium]
PEGNIQHIFEPYFTTKDVGKGTGLGLSLSNDIVKEHQGWIEVFNNKDKGCSFIIYLPCSKAEESVS